MNPDHVEYVSGGGECLAIKTFAPAKIEGGAVLLVSIHGDKSNGRPVGWEYQSAEKFATDRTISVSLLRPGYDDKYGKVSSGNLNGRRDHYTAHNVDAIADAIRNLKAFYRPSKVVLAGYSGGANIAGVIMARHPELADGAVLLACPCDVPRWRSGSSAWSNSLSAHQYADEVSPTKTIVAVTGSRDTNTDISLAQAYVERLKTRGVNGEFRIANGVDHDSALDAPAYAKAVTDVIAAVGNVN